MTDPQLVYSEAGYTNAVEYAVIYRLPNGTYLGGILHQDRPGLANRPQPIPHGNRTP